jgi:hypothetical protein
MRTFLLALMLSGAAGFNPAMADDAEGKIVKVDSGSGTMQLDDKETYKLPGEFDMSSIQPGIEVILVYQVVDGTRVVTDMELME